MSEAIKNVLSLLTKARGWAEELDDSTVILQKEKDELLLNIRRAQLSVEDYENASAEYTKVKVTIQSTTSSMNFIFLWKLGLWEWQNHP